MLNYRHIPYNKHQKNHNHENRFESSNALPLKFFFFIKYTNQVSQLNYHKNVEELKHFNHLSQY